MRAIKRVGMDEKVLVRLKNMLAAHEAEVKQNEADEKQVKKLADEEQAKNAVPEGTEGTDFETPGETVKRNYLLLGSVLQGRLAPELVTETEKRFLFLDRLGAPE